MEYKQKLGNVDATLNTTDKVMKIADPHKVLNTFLTLLIVIALILILIGILAGALTVVFILKLLYKFSNTLKRDFKVL